MPRLASHDSSRLSHAVCHRLPRHVSHRSRRSIRTLIEHRSESHQASDRPQGKQTEDMSMPAHTIRAPRRRPHAWAAQRPQRRLGTSSDRAWCRACRSPLAEGVGLVGESGRDPLDMLELVGRDHRSRGHGRVFGGERCAPRSSRESTCTGELVSAGTASIVRSPTPRHSMFGSRTRTRRRSRSARPEQGFHRKRLPELSRRF